MNRASLLFAALLALLVPLSLLAGRVWIDPFAGTSTTPNAALILMELRLPRAALAIVVGAGLGAAGAAMQGYLRNPLADPGLFGIAPTAALGAVASFWFGASLPPAIAAWSLPAFALLGAGLAMALLALIAGRSLSDSAGAAGGGLALFTLAGLMIASLAGALTALAI
ncbi:MAG: iron chelate uptake ABC transporter family permease subunit, partial [Pseudomonadota bacterium]